MQAQLVPLHEMTDIPAKPRTRIVLSPPSMEPLHDVFAEAMLEDNSVHQHRSPLDWVASFGVHFAILAALLILPLYFTANLDLQKFNLTFLAPPLMPAAPPPPMKVTGALRPVHSLPVHAFKPGQLVAPTFIPRTIATTSASEPAPPEDAFEGVPGGVPGGIPGGQVGGVLGGVLGGAVKNVPAPLPVRPMDAPRAPVRVGGSVKPPRLLFGPDPEYPVLARQARLSGTVVIDAIIDEHGNVTGMRVVSGHPLLIPSALAALSKRKYEPTVLDGEPTPIDLKVEISFSFSS